MAVVAGLGEQVWLVMWLRWRLFRNGLRTPSARLSLVGSIFAGLLWTLMALGIALGIAFGSYLLLKRDQASYLTLILWGIFLFWQFFPILSAQLAPAFESGTLLRFPLRFSSFVILNLAYGFADPAALSGMLWHFALWLGITLARPDLWAGAMLVVGLSAGMNLLFSRMLYAWLERLLAQRRTREILFALFILLGVSLQFTNVLAQKWAKPVAGFARRTSSVWNALPPGQAGLALVNFQAGLADKALIECAALTIYGAAFGLLFAYRLHAEYLGQYFGETAAPAAGRRAAGTATKLGAGKVAASMGRPEAQSYAARGAAMADGATAAGHTRRPWLAAATVAVFWKDLRYLYRNTMVLMNLFLPLIIVGALSLNGRGGGAHGGAQGFRYAAVHGLAYPAAAAYALLILMQSAMNSLAFEGAGVQLLFLAPVKFRSIMLGKNLVQGAVVVLEALLTLALVAAIAGPPPLVVVVSTWLGMAFVGLVNIAAGNWSSLAFPRKLEFGMRSRRQSGMSALFSLLLYFGTVGLLAAVGALVHWLAGAWFVPLAYAGLTAAALAVYVPLLNATSEQAVAQREVLIEQLVR
jgi:ABC-2 type transport system permease protein